MIQIRQLFWATLFEIFGSSYKGYSKTAFVFLGHPIKVTLKLRSYFWFRIAFLGFLFMEIHILNPNHKFHKSEFCANHGSFN